jgi:hypothetical protein
MAFGLSVAWSSSLGLADEARTDVRAEQPAGGDKPDVKKIAPDRFQEVDDAARLLVWLVSACGVGAIVLLALIVMGARRLRRLTRSTALKSKYDELESLRARYRQEMEGVGTPPPPNREARR